MCEDTWCVERVEGRREGRKNAREKRRKEERERREMSAWGGAGAWATKVEEEEVEEKGKNENGERETVEPVTPKKFAVRAALGGSGVGLGGGQAGINGTSEQLFPTLGAVLAAEPKAVVTKTSTKKERKEKKLAAAAGVAAESAANEEDVDAAAAQEAKKEAKKAKEPKKKKKATTVSLADFNAATESTTPRAYMPNAHGFSSRSRDGSTWDDAMLASLPTAPTALAEEEAAGGGGGLGGGFNDYGGGGARDGGRRGFGDRDRDFDDRRRGFGDRDRDFDDRRRGGFGFERDEREDDGFDGPSRADEDDNWGRSKSFVPSGDRDRGGYEFDDRGGPMRSRADDEDNWGRSKSFVPSESGPGGSRRDDDFGMSSKADEVDDWGKSKQFVPSSARDFDDGRKGPPVSRAETDNDWTRKEFVPTDPYDRPPAGSKADAADDWTRNKEELPPMASDREYAPRVSKADATDDWSKTKEELPPPVNVAPAVSKADATDNWSKKKDFVPSPRSSTDTPRASDSVDDWSKGKTFVSTDSPRSDDWGRGGGERRAFADRDDSPRRDDRGRDRWTFDRERPADIDGKSSWRGRGGAGSGAPAADTMRDQPPRERPQLKLSGRSENMDVAVDSRSSSSRSSSLFGGARPREEKLKELGRDYIKEDERMSRTVARKETGQEKKLRTLIALLRTRVDNGEGDEVYVKPQTEMVAAGAEDATATPATEAPASAADTNAAQAEADAEAEAAVDGGADADRKNRKPLTVAEKLALSEERLAKLTAKLDDSARNRARNPKFQSDAPEHVRSGPKDGDGSRRPPRYEKKQASYVAAPAAAAATTKTVNATPAAEPAAAPKRASEPRAWRDIASMSATVKEGGGSDQKKTDAKASNGEEAKKSNDGWSEVRSDKKNRKSNNNTSGGSGGGGGGGGEKRRDRKKVESN